MSHRFKTLESPAQTIAVAGVIIAAIGLFLTPARAACLTWDGNGATAPNPDGGSGTWDLIFNNWWDGSTNVVWPALGGTDDDAVFGNTAGTVSIAAGGVTANDVSFSTTGYIIQTNTLTLNGTTPTITTDPGVSATISSIVAGTVGLTKSGTGTLTLSGANTYSGGTTISSGTVTAGHVDALGTGAVVNDGTLTYGTAGGITVKNAISGTGAVTGSSAGALTINSNLTMTGGGGFNLADIGTTTMSAGRTLSVVNGTGILAGTSSSTGTSITGTQTLTASGTGSMTLSGTSSASSGGIPGLDFSGATVNISGNINFNGTSGQNGLRFISTSGTSTINALSGTTTFTAKGTGGGGQRIISFQQHINASIVNFNASPGAAIVFQPDSTSTASSPTFQSVTAQPTIDVSGNVSFLGRATNTGVFWTGSPIFNVAASGALTINGRGDTMSNGITMSFTGAGASATIASATSTAGTMTGTMSIASGTLTYDITGSGVITSSGVTSGSGGSLVKSGSGTLALSGNNTYTGTTTISGGTLLATNFGVTSATGTGAVSVATTATLGGTGRVAGATTIATTGILSPGNNSVSTLNFGSTLTLDSGSTYAVTITGAATHDRVIATGTLTANGSIAVTLSGYVPVAGDTFDLADSAGSITGAPTFDFTAATLGAGLLWDTSGFATNGTITVANSASYTTWINGFTFAPGADKTPTGDPDADGISNGAEMVLGGDPATGMDSALQPTIELVTDPAGVPAGDYLLFTYRRSDLSVTANVSSGCETSTDLIGWTPAIDGTAGVVILTDDNYGAFVPAAANTDRVRVYVPRAANTTLFGRLNLVVP